METQAQLAQLGLFDARVPRYTSYPTAPQFTPGIDVGEFEFWIRALEPGSQVSLYLHVPFCRRLCWFCACRTQGTSSLAPVLAYVETLRAELQLLRAALPEGVTLSRLHWGGAHRPYCPPNRSTNWPPPCSMWFRLALGPSFRSKLTPTRSTTRGLMHSPHRG